MYPSELTEEVFLELLHHPTVTTLGTVNFPVVVAFYKYRAIISYSYIPSHRMNLWQHGMKIDRFAFHLIEVGNLEFLKPNLAVRTDARL